MSFLNNGTIKRKLMTIIMLTCGVALALACGAILIYEVADYRSVLRRNTEVMADVIGDNSGPPLLFKDEKAAAKTLAALKAEPYVISACVYDKSGVPFATYYRTEGERADPPKVKPESYAFGEKSLQLFKKIEFEGDEVGTIYIQSDLKAVKERFHTYLGIITGVIFSTTMLTFLLSLKLQKHISEPIIHLAEIANKVANQKNYSIRATKTGEDEMGLLVERFNEMLSGIQERDAALLKAHNDLERRVDERTKELQLEIAERTRVETALRVEQQKFESLVNSIDGVVWEASPRDFSFNFVSQQAERLLGHPRAEWTADPDFWTEHLHPDDYMLARDLRQKGLLSEKANHFEYRMLASDARVVWIREISSYVMENGIPQAIRGVLF
jgi:PAS domain-containing protein